MSAPTQPMPQPTSETPAPPGTKVRRRRNRKPKPQLAVPASTLAAMAALVGRRAVSRDDPDDED